MAIIEKAIQQNAWVTITSESQMYRADAAITDLGEPQFLDGGIERGYLHRLFPPELWITTNAHPVLVELPGRPLV